MMEWSKLREGRSEGRRVRSDREMNSMKMENGGRFFEDRTSVFDDDDDHDDDDDDDGEED
jgi:hypothetical protein